MNILNKFDLYSTCTELNCSVIMINIELLFQEIHLRILVIITNNIFYSFRKDGFEIDINNPRNNTNIQYICLHFTIKPNLL